MPDSIETLEDLAPRPGERVLVVGLSGSGKTTLIMEVAPYCRNVVVLDPKRELPSEGYNVITRPEELYWQMLRKRFPIMFRPSKALYDNADMYDRLFRQIFDRGNVTLIIDDVSVFTTANVYPRGLALLCHQGRSKGVSVVTITQSPTNIPACTYRQGTVFFAFYINDEADRKKVNRFVRGYDAMKLRPFEFYYYRQSFEGSAIKCILPDPSVNQSLSA